jgi:hypothetical protein
MILLVTGGREYNDKERVNLELDKIRKDITCIIHGAAKGLDTLVHSYALKYKIPVYPIPAYWDYYNKGAGPVRNLLMISLAPKLSLFYLDSNILLLAFPGNNGTNNMIEQCKTNNIQVIKVGN